MWKLVIEDDESKRTVVPLSRDDYSIGRQEGNTIRLTERNVSRTHGRVRRTRAKDGGTAFVIEDLRSYNGVFVNGLRVAHTQDLQHGDLIQIGDYRIVLEDDTAASFDTTPIPVSATDPNDTKATIPLAPGYRGQTLTERPNRLVMLVGPTPGVEYALDRERMTVGRAEDTTISVNHNSVSRLHCEIHALGDGRFEIVDKGSSNGVRVNAVELRRSIIEAGDVIELGDVRFKFVGAGQVFVAGPNESQQLTAISDREADLVIEERRAGGFVVQIFGALFLGALILFGVVWYLRRQTDERETVTPTAAEVEMAEARATCNVNDCERAYQLVAGMSEADARFVRSTWAESQLVKARAESNTSNRQPLLMRILQDAKIDEEKRKEASDLLSAATEPTTTPGDLPVAAGKDGGTAPTPSVATSTKPAPSAHPSATPTSHATVTNAASSAPTRTPAPSASGTKPSLLDQASEAALQGHTEIVRQLLEQRVRSGRATSYHEANLLYSACKATTDQACMKDVKAKYPDYSF